MTNFEKIANSPEIMSAFLQIIFDEGYVCGYNEFDNDDAKSEYVHLDWLNQKYNSKDDIWIDVSRKIKQFGD